MYPLKKEFLKLSKHGNLIPVYEEILADLETPVSAYLKVAASSKYAFLLESVEGGEKVSRYSFLARDPEFIFQSRGNTAEIINFINGKQRITRQPIGKSPLDILERIMKQYRFVPVKGLPRFCGGLIGYIGYDMVRFFESLPQKPHDDLKLADTMLSLTKNLIIFDHLNHMMKIVCCVAVNPQDSDSKKLAAYRKAQRVIKKTIQDLNQPAPAYAHSRLKKSKPLKTQSTFSQTQFENAVKKAKQQIRAGEIIQVVLSQRLKARIQTNPINIYRSLRTVNPSPYMYLLQFDDLHIIGSSPELLIRCENGIVETRPIAGTRPRGGSEKEDLGLAKNLLADPKERAEHIMLVDLGRNDLGRICRQGSIHLTEFMRIEHYSHVMHIVSNVQGILKKDKTLFDVIRAGFPAGTVSGAPKIRAMEIIDQLEPVARGPYAGCVGYLSFSGNLDTCITIRTIVIKGKTAYIQAGAGIVADSNPRKEFLETRNKAQAQVAAIEMAHKNFP